MSQPALLKELEEEQLKTDIPRFHIGDTVRVHTRIKEGGKERIQVFMGTVIARRGSGLSETFSVRRVAYGEGTERLFLLHSPRIDKIEVASEGIVRQAKLYYLRGTAGKKSKVKKRVVSRYGAPPKKKKAVAIEPQEESPSEDKQPE